MQGQLALLRVCADLTSKVETCRQAHSASAEEELGPRLAVTTFKCSLILGLPEQQAVKAAMRERQVQIAADWWQHCLVGNRSADA